ncbi:MAG: DUF938 domain-containing protein [Gammaproteobacteria bacterium]|nr:DUF938 domain-containing protein [Gammaproteobacteria bacterium]
MTGNLLFSQACENNKQAILEVLQTLFTEPGLIFEIGSGSGQHAVHMASALPHLTWQPTDRGETLPSIEAYRQQSSLNNINPALTLDVFDTPWSVAKAEGVFSANTAHIMSWLAVTAMFSGVAGVLQPGCYFCLYGPFNYQGEFTSEGNIRLDAWARSIDPESGIRDIEKIVALAEKNNLVLLKDCTMPANNRLLQFVKH